MFAYCQYTYFYNCTLKKIGVLRTILGATRLDKARNTSISEAFNVTALLDEIERNKLRWFGYVMRLDENIKPRKYLEWKPNDKRPARRPRRRLMERVEVHGVGEERFVNAGDSKQQDVWE